MQVEAEVSRLEELKSSKMKELVLKKRAELEEICRRTRLIPEIDSEVENAVEAIESGNSHVRYHWMIAIISSVNLKSVFFFLMQDL